jgi:hypothetical protein
MEHWVLYKTILFYTLFIKKQIQNSVLLNYTVSFVFPGSATTGKEDFSSPPLHRLSLSLPLTCTKTLT